MHGSVTVVSDSCSEPIYDSAAMSARAAEAAEHRWGSGAKRSGGPIGAQAGKC